MSEKEGKTNEADRAAEPDLRRAVPGMNTNQGNNMNSNEQPKVRLSEQPVVEIPAALIAKYVHVIGPTGSFKTNRVSPEIVKKLTEEWAKRDDADRRGQQEEQEGGES